MTSWQEHTPFAMFLVDVLRPRIFVELGTHLGDSYCSFCQAVVELSLPASCYAVDTWTGDEHAGSYGEEVLTDLRAHHDPLYGSFSELLRMRFDAAAPRFADGSVDLLHIDGCHTYEAARHDFDTWRPKLSKRGVVLLHDTARRIDGFGVWRLLEELATERPVLEFTHGNGLAMVLVGDEPAEELLPLTALAGHELAALRALFAALGAGVRRAGELQRAPADAADAAFDAQLRGLGTRLATVERDVRGLNASPVLRLARWMGGHREK